MFRCTHTKKLEIRKKEHHNTVHVDNRMPSKTNCQKNHRRTAVERTGGGLLECLILEILQAPGLTILSETFLNLKMDRFAQ